MTEPALVVEVPPDARWVPLPIDQGTDVDAWAAGTAREALRLRGEKEPGSDRLERAAAVLAGLARNALTAALEYPTAGVWALVPGQEVLPETLATLRPVFHVAAGSIDALVSELLLAPEQRYAEPHIEMLDTASGPAARVVQRVRVRDEAGRDDEVAVEESLAYAWWLPQGDLGLVLSTHFVDLVAAGRWRSDCDDLARSLRVHVQ